MTTTARRRCLWLIVLAVLAPNVTRAQICIGDCDGSETLTVEELVRGVGIFLGGIELGQCPSFDRDGNGRVTVDELVRAVADALYGCGVEPPTPAPTRTPTPTVPPTASHTPTPAPPDLAGAWREDQLSLVLSSCPTAVTNAGLEAARRELPCDHRITQEGRALHIIDCVGEEADVVLEPDDTLRLDIPPVSTTENGCTVEAITTVNGTLANNAGAFTYVLSLTFSGTCPLSPCTLSVQTSWTRRP